MNKSWRERRELLVLGAGRRASRTEENMDVNSLCAPGCGSSRSSSSFYLLLSGEPKCSGFCESQGQEAQIESRDQLQCFPERLLGDSMLVGPAGWLT